MTKKYPFLFSTKTRVITLFFCELENLKIYFQTIKRTFQFYNISTVYGQIIVYFYSGFGRYFLNTCILLQLYKNACVCL